MKKNVVAFALSAAMLLITACTQPNSQNGSTPSAAESQLSSVSSDASFDQEAFLQTMLDYVATTAIPVDGLSQHPNDIGLGDYKVVLMGEQHATVGNYAAELAMLKYLNTEYSNTHLIVEYGIADVWLLNTYLETGNTDIVETFVQMLSGTSAGSKELVGFWGDIYAYNQTLPAEQRIRVYAGDLQHSYGSAAYAMHLMLPDVPPPSTIVDGVELLSQYGEMSREESTLFDQFRTNATENREAYESWLGSDTWVLFEEILRHVDQRDEYYSADDEVYREGLMKAYFEEAFETAPEQQWMGIYGGAHTYLNGVVWGANEGENLANHLMHSYEVTSGRVASITFCYYNSDYMEKDGTATPMEPQFAFFNPVFDRLEADISLCPLEGENSPFGPPNDMSLETQQYLMLIQNSVATTHI